MLQSHPTGETINWSQSAKQLHIPGKNAGQVLKEYAIEQGFNVLDMEIWSKRELGEEKREGCPTKNSIKNLAHSYWI